MSEIFSTDDDKYDAHWYHVSRCWFPMRQRKVRSGVESGAAVRAAPDLVSGQEGERAAAQQDDVPGHAQLLHALGKRPGAESDKCVERLQHCILVFTSM